MRIFLEQKQVKIRKPYKCYGCARMLPKGSTMTRITEVNSGEFIHSKWCLVCGEYWDRHMTADDTIDMGELKFEDETVWEEVRGDIEGD